MTRYLLGDLPESEEATVEQEYFADPEKVEEVWAAENDLVDRYARGRLSRGERELLERNYLQSPKHRGRVAVAKKLLEAADSQVAEGGVAPRVIARAPTRLMETLNALRRPWFLAPAATFLLLLSSLSWLSIERSRLNVELEKTRAMLSDQQRQERDVADQLAAERAQSSKLKSENDRLRETISHPPPQSPLSIISFLLTPTLSSRGDGETLPQITIPRGTDRVRLRIKIGTEDSRRFQAAIRIVGGPHVWNQRSLKPRSGEITVNVPADKLPVQDYILKLSATIPTGETEEINKYRFRVVRK